MVHSMTPLRNFANYINLKLIFEGNIQTSHYHASNNKSERKIVIERNFPKWKKIATLAHELGHALQSPKEFEVVESDEFEDKIEFILSIEKDAWEKGEAIVRTLYSNLTEDFWINFNEYKEQALESYIEALKNNHICEIFFKKYKTFIFNNQAEFSPIGLEFFDSLKHIV
jgi:hypothetical protein